MHNNKKADFSSVEVTLNWTFDLPTLLVLFFLRKWNKKKINLTSHTEMFCFFDIHECTSSHVQPLDVIFGKIRSLPRAPSASRSWDFFGHVVTRDQKTRRTCPLLCYFLSCPSNVLLDVFRKGIVPYEICTLSMHFL